MSATINYACEILCLLAQFAFKLLFGQHLCGFETFVFSWDYINQLQRTSTICTVNLMEGRTATVHIVLVLPIKIAGSAECQIIVH